MSLADLANSGPGRGVCACCRVLEMMEEDNAAILRKALANPYASYPAISSELVRMGYDVNASALRHHAIGACIAGERLREPRR